MIESVIKDFISFLRYPIEEFDSGRSGIYKIKVIVILFLVELPFLFLFGGIITILKYFNFDFGSHKLTELLEGFSYLQIVLITVIVGPFFEEIIFRLPLKYQRNYLARFIVFCVSATHLIPQEKLNDKVQIYRKVSFKYLFYFLAIAFGFAHLFNFENYKDLFLLLPMLTMTQIIGGLIMGYLRIRYGFIWGFFYHGFFNFVMISLAFISINSDFSYHYNKDGVSIAIEKCDPSGSHGISLSNTAKAFGYAKITSDTIEFNRYRIKDVVSDLLMIQGKYVISNDFQSGSFYNVLAAYANHGNNSASSREILMGHIKAAFGIKIEKKSFQKEAWELYLVDSLKLYGKEPKADFMQVKGNMKSIGKYFDRKYSKEFIFSTDTIHTTLLNIPLDIAFYHLPEYLKQEYGIGLRRVSREIEFVIIKLKNLI